MYLKSHKELIVWQKSILLAKAIFKLTERLPKSEIFELTSQMRRAAVSIASNIAEGYGRKSHGEFQQFLGIAYGSALELETQLTICTETGLLKENESVEANSLLQEVLKMLNSMTSRR